MARAIIALTKYKGGVSDARGDQRQSRLVRDFGSEWLGADTERQIRSEVNSMEVETNLKAGAECGMDPSG